MDTEQALDAASRALRAVGNTRLFDQLSDRDVSRLITTLQKEVRSGALPRKEDLVLRLKKHFLDQPLLSLFVQSALVKAMRQELGEDDSSDSDSDWLADSDSDDDVGDEENKNSNPMANMNSGRIADYLLKALNETPNTRQLFIKHADTLGADGVWEALQECNRLIANDDPTTYVADRSRKRTAGGVFLNVCKQRASVAKKKAEAASSPPSKKLRPYQRQAVDTITGRGGNWVVAAPTNTGKTSIFIEVSKHILSTKPKGTVVVLVPTVSLTRQQCNAYEAAGFRPASGSSNLPSTAPTVDWFCGDKPLPPGTWKQEVNRLNVIVIEAQSFANLVDNGHASLTDVDLLVFDEAHHTAKQHPYSRVMVAWTRVTPAERRPQVVGVSASPAQTETKLAQLLACMQARLIVVPEDDEVVQQVAPAPNEESRTVGCRELDGYLQEWLRHLMLRLAQCIGASLERVMMGSKVTSATRQAVEDKLVDLPSEILMRLNPAQAYGVLCMWMNAATEMAKLWRMNNLGTCLQILEVLRRAEAICLEIGNECALQFLAQHLIPLGTPGVVTDEVPLAPPPASKKARLDKFTPDSVALPTALSALSQHVSQGPSPAEILREADHLRAMCNTLLQAAPCPDIKLTGHQVTRAVLSQLALWDAEPSTLLQVAKDGVISHEDAPAIPEMSDQIKAVLQNAIENLLPGGVDAPPVSHPKVWELIQYLQRHKNRADFHGIIFCRSRQTAHFLVELLRTARLSPVQQSPRKGKQSPQKWPGQALLGFVDVVTLFVGHGQGKALKGRSLGSILPGSGTAASSAALAAKGMNVNQQQAVLDEFKLPGRKLLVATNAAEEGLDLPCCEFVVRFSPPATGIQRVQGRGRARMVDAHYFSLLQDVAEGTLVHGGVDLALHAKSQREETIMKDVLHRVASSHARV